MCFVSIPLQSRHNTDSINLICFNHFLIFVSPLVIASHKHTLTQSLVNIESSYSHVTIVRTFFSSITVTPLYFTIG